MEDISKDTKKLGRQLRKSEICPGPGFLLENDENPRSAGDRVSGFPLENDPKYAGDRVSDCAFENVENPKSAGGRASVFLLENVQNQKSARGRVSGKRRVLKR